MRTLLLLLVIAMLNTTCKKDPPPHQNTLSAKVNGVFLDFPNIELSITASTSWFKKKVNLIGRTTEAGIVLSMDPYDGEKSYFNLDGSYGDPATYTPKCPDIACPYSLCSSGGGGLRIDSFKKTTINGEKGEIITGTFIFESNGTAGKYSITDGKFSLFVP